MNGGMEAIENILDRLISLERTFGPANVAAVAFHLGDQASLSLDNRLAVRQMPLNRFQAVARRRESVFFRNQEASQHVLAGRFRLVSEHPDEARDVAVSDEALDIVHL
jgi:hypothetical protein